VHGNLLKARLCQKPEDFSISSTNKRDALKYQRGFFWFHLNKKTISKAPWPEPNAGVRRVCAEKHIWVLIFFGSFLDQAKKRTREKKIGERGN
jgi:hypothetical protein